MMGQENEDRGWQLALGLIAVWRRTGDARKGAVAQALAEAAERDPTTAEQAVIGLTALVTCSWSCTPTVRATQSTASSGTPWLSCTAIPPASAYQPTAS